MSALQLPLMVPIDKSGNKLKDQQHQQNLVYYLVQLQSPKYDHFLCTLVKFGRLDEAVGRKGKAMVTGALTL